MDNSDLSQSNLIIVTKRDRFKWFCKLYWRSLVLVLSPLVLMPLAFVGTNNAYKCFYAFVLTATYWITDAIHPSVAAMVPIALSSVMGSSGHSFISEIYIRNELLDCAGVMMLILAIEQSQLHRRMALKLLIVFGCSHYRLSFILFFTCMFLSMWFSSILICGLMMPLMKAVVIELEKMGILEMYATVGKEKQKLLRHGSSHPRPTDFTLFYFLGIAHSSSIGAMATLMSSQTNQIFKIYCEKIFPSGPKIEFPNLMLLNLPGVIVMETILYFWMNFYFIGMFRKHASLEIGMTEEEAQYVKTLLSTQYDHLPKILFSEGVLIFLVLLTALLQATVSSVYIDSEDFAHFHIHFRISTPCILLVLILFILPINPDFTGFFKKRSDRISRPLPQESGKTCLVWSVVRANLDWGVFFIISGSSVLFESLQDSQMTEEFEKFLLLFSDWPSSALMLVTIIFCKILTEFAPSTCVAYCLLPHIARLSILCKTNPHYMMLAATISISQSFHLATGAPVNAMVASYVHIPPWKMMVGGLAPSLAAVVVAWFTVAAWCTTIWADVSRNPEWAANNVFVKAWYMPASGDYETNQHYCYPVRYIFSGFSKNK